MDKQRQDDQLEPIYNSSVPIQDIALKTSREQWKIETGGQKGSGRSALAARHDDDDDRYQRMRPTATSYILQIFIQQRNRLFDLSAVSQFFRT